LLLDLSQLTLRLDQITLIANQNDRRSSNGIVERQGSSARIEESHPAMKGVQTGDEIDVKEEEYCLEVLKLLARVDAVKPLILLAPGDDPELKVVLFELLLRELLGERRRQQRVQLRAYSDDLQQAPVAVLLL